MKKVLVISIFAIFLSNYSWAQENAANADLVKKAQNPIANMVSVPILNSTNFGVGPNNDRTSNLLNIQPVIPFFEGRLITRTIFAIPTVPQFSPEGGSKTGFGPILFSAFYSPKSKNITWGFGPAISFPTGGDEFGSGKWAAGPSLVALAMPGKWVIGGVINNIWSFAGDADRADVNFMTFQPFINYNFPKFYLTYAPIITNDWEAESGNQLTLPVGMGVGKLVKLGGKLPVNLNACYFYNVVTPDNGPDWQIRVLAAILLPTSTKKK
jgi:Putative MetA-pathway of phenol degradation